jgi:hypothetical protein
MSRARLEHVHRICRRWQCRYQRKGMGVAVREDSMSDEVQMKKGAHIMKRPDFRATGFVDRKAEIKAQIELADRILWETRDGPKSYNWMKGYRWLQDERARLVRELSAAEGV